MAKDKVKLEEYINTLTVKKLQDRYTDLEQYGRRNNIRISGIKDSSTRPETSENTLNKMVELLRSKLKIDITEADIDVTHRLGNFNADRNRRVLVKFVSRRHKQGDY